MSNDLDVIIVGAGISGINSAYRLQSEGPQPMRKNYAILESRDAIGGTWDLFRYPGIRSDSDIYTFGFAWRSWDHDEAMATGEQIRDYMRKATEEQGIDQHIRYGHFVEKAEWRSGDARWHLQVRVEGEEKPVAMRARFLLLGTGYYDYKTPLQTVIPGIEDFEGKVIHPQFWPEDYDVTNKDVVIIGSGATAITLVPSIADKARRATMLQRSPGYIFSLPSHSLLTYILFLLLPSIVARKLNRLAFAAKSALSTAFCRTCPGLAKRFIRAKTVSQLPPDVKWDPDFCPRYNPWEQRFCASRDGDFFAALRSGKAGVVTDKIKRVTAKSIELESGKVLHPDVIVTATGLRLKFAGGINLTVDGEPISVPDKFAWKAAMLQDTPNLFFLTGYETASWTLGADVSAKLFVRIAKGLEKQGAKAAVPRVHEKSMQAKPMMSLSSTYVKRQMEVLPKAGEGQWAGKSNYFADMARARWGDVSTDLVFV